MVYRRLSGHPGELGDFDWPVAPVDARLALLDIIDRRLVHLRACQGALRAGESILCHMLLYSSLALKLIDPREVFQIAVERPAGYCRAAALCRGISAAGAGLSCCVIVCVSRITREVCSSRGIWKDWSQRRAREFAGVPTYCVLHSDSRCSVARTSEKSTSDCLCLDGNV